MPGSIACGVRSYELATKTPSNDLTHVYLFEFLLSPQSRRELSATSISGSVVIPFLLDAGILASFIG